MASNALNPNIVVRDLNRIALAEWQEVTRPDVATVRDSMIFNQIPVQYGSQKEEVFAGSGYWDQRNEQQNVPAGDSRTAEKVTIVMNEYAKQENISRWYFEDSEFNIVDTIVRNMTRNGKMTQERLGFEIFRGASSGTLTSDGLSLLNNSHTLVNSGATFDNLETDKLTDGVLNTLIRRLMEQPAQDGVIQMYMPKVLLVPVLRFKLAVELTESEWSAQTANNAVNMFSSKYGFPAKQSPFIGSAISAGAGITAGSDDLAFLLGQGNQINRYIREDLKTDLVDYKYSGNNNYIYKSFYRENYAAIAPQGVAGTTGTTGAYV